MGASHGKRKQKVKKTPAVLFRFRHTYEVVLATTPLLSCGTSGTEKLVMLVNRFVRGNYCTTALLSSVGRTARYHQRLLSYPPRKAG